MKDSKFDKLFNEVKDSYSKKNIVKEDSYDSEAEFQEDGWDQEVQYALSDVLSDISQLQYQLKNCVRGCYSHAKTRQQLADYIHQLAERLIEATDRF